MRHPTRIIIEHSIDRKNYQVTIEVFDHETVFEFFPIAGFTEFLNALNLARRYSEYYQCMVDCLM